MSDGFHWRNLHREVLERSTMEAYRAMSDLLDKFKIEPTNAWIKSNGSVVVAGFVPSGCVVNFIVTPDGKTFPGWGWVTTKAEQHITPGDPMEIEEIALDGSWWPIETTEEFEKSMAQAPPSIGEVPDDLQVPAKPLRIIGGVGDFQALPFRPKAL